MSRKEKRAANKKPSLEDLQRKRLKWFEKVCSEAKELGFSDFGAMIDWMQLNNYVF